MKGGPIVYTTTCKLGVGGWSVLANCEVDVLLTRNLTITIYTCDVIYFPIILMMMSHYNNNDVIVFFYVLIFYKKIIL